MQNTIEVTVQTLLNIKAMSIKHIGNADLTMSLVLLPMCFKSSWSFSPSRGRSHSLPSFPISSGKDRRPSFPLTSRDVRSSSRPICGGIWDQKDNVSVGGCQRTHSS